MLGAEVRHEAGGEGQPPLCPPGDEDTGDLLSSAPQDSLQRQGRRLSGIGQGQGYHGQRWDNVYDDNWT